MKDIDFLPRQYREEHAQRKNQIWRLGVVALYAGLLAMAAYSQRARKIEVEAELAVAAEQHAVVAGQADQLTELQTQLHAERARAELVTYLRHPWPRTQILAAVIEPLPETITLTELRVYRVEPAPSYGQQRDRSRRNAAATPDGQEDKRTPAERDLDSLQAAIDHANTVVTLKGETRDNASLHIYLAQLGKTRLFSKVELLAIESSAITPGAPSRFSARLTVRPGYGQPDGPAPAETALSQSR